MAGVLGLSLTACSQGGSSPSPSPPPSSSAPTSAVPLPPSGPLQMTVYGVPEAIAAYREVADAYTAESGVRVDVRQQADAESAAAAVEQALGESGEGPDVFLIDDASLPSLFETGRLQPLDEELEQRGLQFGDGYQRVALTAFSVDAGLQCMPVDMSPLVMFVNRELVRPRDLAVRGVPLPVEGQWQFEDFDAAARLVAREQRTAAAPGAEFHAVHLPADVELLTSLIRSAGGDIVDDVDNPSELTLDSDEAREVLQAYVRLARQRSVSLSDEDADEVDPVERFGRGRLAMVFGTRADVPALRRTDVRFDVMPLPTFGSPRTVADLAGLCVDNESLRLEDAIDLVAFAAGNEGSTLLARSGAVVPANLDVVFSPAFAQRGLRPRSVGVFRDSQARSGLMPYTSAWDEVAARVERLVARVGADRRGLEKALDVRLPQLDEWSQGAFAVADDGTED